MSNTKMKPCKTCGKDVSKSAAVCPHCGQKLKISLLAKVGIGLLALVAIGMLLPKHADIAAADSNDQQQGEGAKREIAALPTFSSLDLARAYDANTVAADQQFKGKRFKVTGVVTDINTDLMGDPYITMQGVNEFLEPQFAFGKNANNRLATLQKGLQITLICVGKGDIAKTPMSDSCELSTDSEVGATVPTPVPEPTAALTDSAVAPVEAIETSICEHGGGLPALGSEHDGGIYLCREPIENYWNDWYAFALMAREQLPTPGQAELQVKGEGKTSGFSGNLSINCGNGKYSWQNASSFDEPLGSEKEVAEIVPAQVVTNAKKISCTAKFR